MAKTKLEKYTELLLQRAERNLDEAESNFSASSYRVASSQAYYAMYDAASALLAMRGYKPSGESDSEFVKIFCMHFISTGDLQYQLKDAIEAALRTRVACGYDPKHHEMRENSREMLDNARAFLDAAGDQVPKEFARMRTPSMRKAQAREETDGEVT